MIKKILPIIAILSISISANDHYTPNQELFLTHVVHIAAGSGAQASLQCLPHPVRRIVQQPIHTEIKKRLHTQCKKIPGNTLQHRPLLNYSYDDGRILSVIGNHIKPHDDSNYVDISGYLCGVIIGISSSAILEPAIRKTIEEKWECLEESNFSPIMHNTMYKLVYSSIPQITTWFLQNAPYAFAWTLKNSINLPYITPPSWLNAYCNMLKDKCKAYNDGVKLGTDISDTLRDADWKDQWTVLSTLFNMWTRPS